MQRVDGELSVRKAVFSDTALLFQWANQPIVRFQAFAQQPITWFDHIYWCHRRFVGKNGIWVGVLDNREVGQVRFDEDLQAACWLIDIHLDDSYKGKGLGLQLLNQAMQQQAALRPCYYFCALAKVSNTASCRLFEKAGFSIVGLVCLQGQWCWQYERF